MVPLVLTTLLLFPQSMAYGSNDGFITATPAGGAWTNGSIQSTVAGVETDAIQFGNSGVRGFGLGDPKAQNGYNAGQYLFLPKTSVPNSILPGSTGNPAFARLKMLSYGFDVSGSYNGAMNGPAFAASDIYILSGEYVPNPQSYYASHSTVPLASYPTPSINVTSVYDQTVQRSASQGVRPGDVIQVSDNFGTSDTAPTAWGSQAGLMAFWNFGGTYVNALTNASNESVPAYGFSPFPNTYQPGIRPVHSFTVTVPAGAMGSGTLDVFYVDGIDREAKSSYPVTVEAQPTIAMSAYPSSLLAGSSSTLTVNTAHLNTGDRVVISQTDQTAIGTLSGNHLSGQTSITYSISQVYRSYTFSPMATSQTAALYRYTAQIRDASGHVVASSGPASVQWLEPSPSVGLSISPQTSQTVGSSFELTASTHHVNANDTVTITETQASVPDTLNGNTTKSWTVPGTYENYDFKTSVLSTQSQEVAYQATIHDQGNGKTYSSNVATASWTNSHSASSPTLRLQAASTSLVEGQSTILTASLSPSSAMPGNSSIYLYDEQGDHTLTNGLSQFEGPIGQTPIRSGISSDRAQTVTYVAKVLFRGRYIHSNGITVVWSPGTTPPVPQTITLIAHPSSVGVGHATTLTAVTTYRVGANKSIYIHEVSGGTGTTLGGKNVFEGPIGVASATTLADDVEAQTVEYEAALQLENGAYVRSLPVYVRWSTNSKPGSTPSTTTGGCTPPSPPPAEPQNQVLSYAWTPNADGSETLTWTDTHWTLETTKPSDSQGCSLITYQWTDRPVKYVHMYRQDVSDMQITGLFYDLGTPSNPWSPSNPGATQNNHDGLTDGSLQFQPTPMPTYGNPDVSPSIYVRVNGSFAIRMLWTGSPADLPVGGHVTFDEVNPDGSTRTWTRSLALLRATLTAPNPVPVWDGNGFGYPSAAREYVMVSTRVLKYATNQDPPVSYQDLAKWNLTGDPKTAAHISFSLTADTLYGWFRYVDDELAQLFGYPTWYFIHQVMPSGQGLQSTRK